MPHVTVRSFAHAGWWAVGATVAILALPLASRARAGGDPVAVCAAALDGTAVLAGVQRLGVPLVCEARPAGAPPVAGGEYGLGVIHLWPDGISPSVLRKLAAHELGHAWSTQRPDLTAAWYALRGTSGTAAQEDFAESFYRAVFPEPGLSFVQYGDSYASDAQLDVMRQWWEPWTVGLRGPSPVVGMTPADPAPLAPAVEPLPLAPADEPVVEPLPLAPKSAAAAVVVTAQVHVPNERGRVMLAALREARG